MFIASFSFLSLLPIKSHAIDLPIYVNGAEASFASDQMPYVNASSRTMVPIRGVSDELGYNVVWNSTNGTAEVTYSSNKLILPLNSNVVALNGKSITIDSKTEVRNQHVYVPLRSVAEMMGAQVGYDGTTGKISISNANTSTYVVVSGDTLFSISQKFNIKVDQLKSINHLTSDSIFVGEKLIVNANVPVVSTPTPQPTPTPVNPPSLNPILQSQYKKTYMVTKGDTLTAIAKLFNTSVSSLEKINNLPRGNIYVGQKIIISGQNNVKEFNTTNVINSAKKYIGVPYLWGGTTPKGFDCSGLVQYAFNENGVSLTRTTFTQWDNGIPVTTPSYGDLVFFQTDGPGPTHVGIYMGNNQFIEAGTSTGVTITDITYNYWKTSYLGARAIK